MAQSENRQMRGDYTSLEAFALDQVQTSKTVDDRVKNAEVLKSIADARSSAETRFQRTQSLIITITQVLALVVTLIVGAGTILFQNRQFLEKMQQQAAQARDTATLQRQANEDAQWREALKFVSFKDDQASAVGAFVMQGFFASQDHGPQARTIACALLVNVSNVGAFDEVLERIAFRTTDQNSSDIYTMAQMMGYSQRSRFHITGAASKANTPYLDDVDEINPAPAPADRTRDQMIKVAAWELDSVSQNLHDLWKRAKDPLSPAQQVLTAVVLENASADDHNFDKLDFSGAYLDFGILSNARFKGARFKRATLKHVHVHHVDLTDADFSDSLLNGADLSGVTQYKGSTWGDSNWWDAKCIPQPMLAYLQQVAPHALTPAAESRLVSTCK